MVPVHGGHVAPKVTCPVSRTDLHCIDKDWITLEEIQQNTFLKKVILSDVHSTKC